MARLLAKSPKRAAALARPALAPTHPLAPLETRARAAYIAALRDNTS